MKRISLFALLCLVLVSCKKDLTESPALSSNAKSAPSTSSTTQQSVMVAIDYPGDIILSGEETYHFDDDAAALYFTGGTENDRKNVAREQRCTFWNGGTLTAVSVGGGPNAELISPISTNPVSAKTAWNLDNSTGATTGSANLNFFIAGESAVKNSKKDATKYSFSLDGRISDLKMELLKEGNVYATYAVADLTLTTSIIGGLQPFGNAFVKDIVYNFNGFRSANYDLLRDGITLEAIIGLNGYADKTVNDLNTQIMTITPINVSELPEGSYSIRVTGSVKGNPTDAISSPFNVTGGNFTIGGIGNCAKQ